MYMREAKHNYTYYQCENIAKTFVKIFLTDNLAKILNEYYKPRIRGTLLPTGMSSL